MSARTSESEPLEPERVAGEIEAELRALGTAERARKERAYLKSELEFLGATVPEIRRVVKATARAHPDLGRDDLLALVEALWSVPMHERRMAAVRLLELRGELLVPEDVDLLERLISESRTWAYVDALAAAVVGPLVERHAELVGTLDRWARDPDFWIRRSAMLALLPALRRGEGDFERFAGYADAMLEEREFFIRKAIGWVLREAAKKRPQLVYEWLLPRARRASGLTVREAVKPLPDEQRREITAARDR